MQLKELKKGDSIKKYSCYKFEDINSEIFLKGATEVITDFTF